MSITTDFAPGQAFETRGAENQSVPFIFNSPHSGNHYPDRFLAMARLDRNAIRRSEDGFVDELFEGAVAQGAPLLAARFPRAYLDVNREPWELDPRMFTDPVPSFANTRSPRVAGGLGTVPRIVGEGQEIYACRLPLAEAVARIEGIYKPYHLRLRDLLIATRARFGYAVLIDCHSMPAGVRVGDTGMRPDIIVGDRFGASTTPALCDRAIEGFASMGYTVAHNKPYAGGFITEHYGRPAHGLHALQIEVNRSLYMNERTFQKTDGFAALSRDLSRLVSHLLSLPGHFFEPHPIAAE